MRAAALADLVCPRTGQGLVLEEVAPARASDHVDWGVLRSEVATYPIVEGIPVFVDSDPGVVDLLRRGALCDALALATFGTRPRTRPGRLVEGLSTQGGRLGHLVGPARRALQDKDRRDRVELLADVPGRRRRVLAEHHLRGAFPSEDGYLYFHHRFGTPRHLVALAFASVTSCGARVLDLGCGAGQVTWGLSTRSADVTGVDRELPLLLLAADRTPTADFVCADAVTLPFPEDRFDVVVSTDVLSYVSLKRTAMSEVRRVRRRSGWFVATSVRNRSCHHVFGGEALTAAGWTQLATGEPHRLLPDALVLDAYLARQPPPLGTPVDRDTLERSQTLTLAVGPEEVLAALACTPVEGWVHADGPLAVHPLFAPLHERGRTIVYRRREPSAVYARDNADLDRYLPHEVELAVEDVVAAERGARPPGLDAAIDSCAVLALPDGEVDERWPRPSASG